MNKRLALIISLAIFAPSLASAEPRIVAQKIPGIFTVDGTGAYDKLYAALQTAAGAALPKLEVISAGRAIALFEKGEADCQTPANGNRDFYPVDFKTIQSKPFNVAKVYIFSKPGSPPFTSLDALKGKKIAVREGFSYGAAFDAAKLQPETSLTIEANIKKLLEGQIDAIVDFIPDAWDAFANFGMAPLPYQADKPVAIHQDAVVCRDTPATQALIATIDRGIATLKASDALKEILGSSYSPE